MAFHNNPDHENGLVYLGSSPSAMNWNTTMAMRTKNEWRQKYALDHEIWYVTKQIKANDLVVCPESRGITNTGWMASCLKSKMISCISMKSPEDGKCASSVDGY
jgi:hypothetical protein